MYQFAYNGVGESEDGWGDVIRIVIFNLIENLTPNELKILTFLLIILRYLKLLIDNKIPINNFQDIEFNDDWNGEY